MHDFRHLKQTVRKNKQALICWTDSRLGLTAMREGQWSIMAYEMGLDGDGRHDRQNVALIGEDRLDQDKKASESQKIKSTEEYTFGCFTAFCSSL